MKEITIIVLFQVLFTTLLFGQQEVGGDEINGILESEKLTEENGKVFEFKKIIDKDYLILPVKKYGKDYQTAAIQVDDSWNYEFTINIPTGKEDYYVFMDLTPYEGKEVKLTFNNPPESIIENLKKIRLSNEIPGKDTIYREKLRPNFHFSAPRGWLNDPNGMFYLDGVYTMYYQHNPFGHYWGNVHWGRATTTDLVHWDIKPVGIVPRGQNAAWTGSAVVDNNNTSGFKVGDLPPVVVAYTRKGAGTVLQYSNDGGITFDEYKKNPVVKGVGDPNIVWYEPGQHWVMVHRNWNKDGEGIGFYTSEDLKVWEYQSRIAPFHVCPMLFQLPVVGTTEKKWVVHDGHLDYMIGDFDGKVFKPLTEKIVMNEGFALVASQIFNNTAQKDNRIIRMAWAANTYAPGMPFNQCMTVPARMVIKETGNGLRIMSNPVKELELLYQDKIEKKNISLACANKLINDYPNGQYRLKLKIEKPKEDITILFNGLKLKIDTKDNLLKCKGLLDSFEGFAQDNYRWRGFNEKMELTAPLDLTDGVDLDILVDNLIIEIFAEQGAVYIPLSQFVFKKATIYERGWGDDGKQHIDFFSQTKGITIISNNSKQKVKELGLYKMGSMWSK